MPDPRVIVFGYGELGIAAVRTLAAAGASVDAIVVPGNRAGDHVDRVRAFAAERRLPVWIQPPRRAVDPFVRQVRAAAPDVLVVWSYSRVLPQAVLDVPRLGAVNVHGGLLPQYRGGHVMQWAIINGEPETGATLHYMDANIDTGPVIAEARFPIDDDDDAVQVRAKLMSAGAGLLRRWWPQIADGTAPRIPQDETRARHWPMRTPEDGRIDWNEAGERICRLIRALACNDPGGFVEVDGRIVTIRQAQALPPAERSEPGRVRSAGPDGVRVAAGGGDILVTTLIIDHTVVEGSAVAEILRPGRSLVSAHAHG
jgi:methionyl-tRNA formyltransferase